MDLTNFGSSDVPGPIGSVFVADSMVPFSISSSKPFSSLTGALAPENCAQAEQVIDLTLDCEDDLDDARTTLTIFGISRRNRGDLKRRVTKHCDLLVTGKRNFAFVNARSTDHARTMMEDLGQDFKVEFSKIQGFDALLLRAKKECHQCEAEVFL